MDYPTMLYKDVRTNYTIAQDADHESLLRAEGWQSLPELLAPEPPPRRHRRKEPESADDDPGSPDE